MMKLKRKEGQYRWHRIYPLLFLLPCSFNYSPAANILVRAEETSSAASDFVCSDDTHECLNGGSCVEGIAKGTGKLIQVCDCQEAIDRDGNRYVGLYCEVEAPKENQFCVNGGTPHTIQSGVVTCSCPKEYTGLYCELAKSTEQLQAITSSTSEAKCSLECLNGGICAFGRRVPTAAELNLYPNFDPNSNKNEKFFYEYCQCPTSFYGKQCESSYDVCKNGERSDGDDDDDKGEAYCHNNSTCVYTKDMYDDDDDGRFIDADFPKFWCNCTAAKTPGNHFTGEFCEYRNLVTCNAHSQSEERQFCTNGGTCEVDKNGGWYCACPEGYDGIHCQGNSKKAPEKVKAKNKSVQTSSNNNRSTGNNTTIFFFLISGLVVIVLFVIISRARRYKEDNVEEGTGQPTPPSLAFVDMHMPPASTSLDRATSAPVQEFPLSQYNGRMSFNSRRFKTPNTNNPIVAAAGRSSFVVNGSQGGSGSNRRLSRMIDMTPEEEENLNALM